MAIPNPTSNSSSGGPNQVLFNTPGLTVSGTSQNPSVRVALNNVPYTYNEQGAIQSGLAQARWLNILGGFRVIIESATAASGQQILCVNTGATGPAIITLDNDELVGPTTSFALDAGESQNFVYDGTNFNIQN
jgi:hypothetical protein